MGMSGAGRAGSKACWIAWEQPVFHSKELFMISRRFVKTATAIGLVCGLALLIRGVSTAQRVRPLIRPPGIALNNGR
jgi:hypothetical protein